MDWVHHIVMIFIMLPFAYAIQPGHLLGHGCFFGSGLPGGIDYAMLVCVKKGWMQSLTEKRVNTKIQLWLRAPGCIYHALLVWVGWQRAQDAGYATAPVLPTCILAGTKSVLLAVFVVMTTFFWNGLFFLGRVATNYGARNAQARMAAQGTAVKKN